MFKMLLNFDWFGPFELKLCQSIHLDELVLNMMPVSSESLIVDRFRKKNKNQKPLDFQTMFQTHVVFICLGSKFAYL